MVLTEKLMIQGSHVLLIETAHGHHFDLVQKVSFLEHFDSAARGVTDKCAQKLVRDKAGYLRTSLVPLIKKASSEELPQNAGLGTKDTISVCSYGCMSTSTASTVADSGSAGSTSSAGSDVAWESPAGGEGSSTLLQGTEDKDLTNSTDSRRAVKYSNLNDVFHRITESGLLDIPEEFCTPIIDASYDAGSRQVILMHLQNCLSEKLALTQWRRVYCGLVLTYNLLERGSPLLFIERPHGLNDYDLASEVYFLQFFEYRTDWRAQVLYGKRLLSCVNNSLKGSSTAALELLTWLPHQMRKLTMPSSTCAHGWRLLRTGHFPLLHQGHHWKGSVKNYYRN